MTTTDPATLHFDTSGLMIGTATASLQIEGGDRNNNWYDWASVPGNIADGSTPLRATDHWHRWREDNDLMADLGLQTYRMSLEWSRIEPRPNEFDQAAIERYREEIADLVDRGIRPLVTLHHFSHPSWFAGLGGFTCAASPEIFVRFIEAVVPALSDLVTDWVTINEPNVYAVQAYLFNESPPGGQDWPALRKTLRNMTIAHWRAYRRIHELASDAKVGFAHHARVFEPMNPRNPLHKAMTVIDRSLFQDQLADGMLTGKMPRLLGKQPRDVGRGKYYDFIGINYYSRTAVRGIEDGTFPGSPINDLGWEIYPDGLVQVARELHQKHPAPIWITENGTADAADGFRSRYIYDHLKALVESGLPVERYYHWCFVDNWEWAAGEAARFGMVGLDYETQERHVRDSARFVSRVIAEGGVSQGAYDTFVAHLQYPRLA